MSFLKHIRGNQYCAVLVTFFPDNEIQIRVKRLLCQFCKIVIVDNGSIDTTFINNLSTLDKYNQIDIIRNKINLGIAAALNQGIIHAIKKGFSWIALFDQDSLLDGNALESIRKVINNYPDKKQLLIIGCNIKSPGNQLPKIRHDDSDPDWIETEQVITSGSILSSRAFDLVGMFNEQLFIDYVDIDYCLRIKYLGYKTVIARNAYLYHEVGKQSKFKVFNRIIHPTHHSPERRYYQFRNSFLLFKTYSNLNLKWVKHNAFILAKILTSIIMFEPDKLIKFQHIAKGVYHGILGRAGKNGEKAFIHSLYPMK